MTLSTSAVAVCCCSDFAQFVEQAGVLDGDDCLLSKIANKLDLLIGEGTDLLPVDGDGADQLALFEHGHSDVRARARELDDARARVPLVRREVHDVDHLLRFDHAP